jgi:hypothetical protein
MNTAQDQGAWTRIVGEVLYADLVGADQVPHTPWSFVGLAQYRCLSSFPAVSLDQEYRFFSSVSMVASLFSVTVSSRIGGLFLHDHEYSSCCHISALPRN